MEDLTQAGFSHHATSLTVTQAETVLRWLACFHAQFVIKRSDISHNKINVWEHGTYWHLSTRMDEFNAMQESELKGKAHAVSEKLDECEYQTLVHGDAKVANFCFTSCFEHCAAVDFQYVGYGVGIKDVAYFLGSALSTSEQSKFLSYFLSVYFDALKEALRLRNTQLIDSTNAEDAPYPFAFLSEDDIATLEMQWRNLFSFACADFHRFLSGWSPTHWKIDTLLQQQTLHALSLLTQLNYVVTKGDSALLIYKQFLHFCLVLHVFNVLIMSYVKIHVQTQVIFIWALIYVYLAHCASEFSGICTPYAY